MFKYKENEKFLLGLCLLVFLFFINKTFLYSYTVLQEDYETRMDKFGGYCEKYGYGFVTHISKKIKFKKNIKIKNYGNYPSIESYFYDIKKDIDSKYLILINITDSQFNKNYLEKNYSIIEKQENCYLVYKI